MIFNEWYIKIILFIVFKEIIYIKVGIFLKDVKKDVKKRYKLVQGLK